MRKRYLLLILLVPLVIFLSSSLVLSPSENPENNSTIGIEYFSIYDVYHIWNEKDDYYVDATSGIQITNHFQEYWSHNLVCIRILTGKGWEEFCADALVWDWYPSSDNSTYANLVGETDLQSGGYKAHVTVEYYLHSNWTEMRITPTFENNGLDVGDSEFILKVHGIQIDMTAENDFIELNLNDGYRSWNLSNSSLSLSFSQDDLAERVYYLNEYPDNHLGYWIITRWNESFWKNGIPQDMNYTLDVIHDSEFNAPVVLTLGIGVVSKGDVVSTNFRWHDPDYTMTSNSVTASDTDIYETEKINVTINIDADSKSGDWALYLNTTDTLGNSVIIDNDCTDENDAWKLVDVFEDGSVCTVNNLESDYTVGYIWCDGEEDYGVDEIFNVESCSGSSVGSPYIFYSYCQGENGNDICSGFSDASAEVTVSPSVVLFSSPAINDTGDVFEGEGINHTITITNSPDGYIFSWNGSDCSTGNWENSSFIDASSSTVYAWNVTEIPSGCGGKTIGWRYYANNSNDVWNVSSISTYPVSKYGHYEINWTDSSVINSTVCTESDPCDWSQYSEKPVNVSVKCTGGTGAKCGSSSVGIRYNKSSTYMDLINTTEGGSPFFVSGGMGTDFTWNPVNDEGDGVAESNLQNIIGDVSSNAYVWNTSLIFTPNVSIIVTEIKINIGDNVGTDYISSMEVYICDAPSDDSCSNTNCKMFNDSFNPGWPPGWYSITNNTGITVEENKAYAVDFRTPNSDEESDLDNLYVQQDASAIVKNIRTGWSGGQCVANTYYADMNISGTTVSGVSNPTSIGTLEDGDIYIWNVTLNLTEANSVREIDFNVSSTTYSNIGDNNTANAFVTNISVTIDYPCPYSGSGNMEWDCKWNCVNTSLNITDNFYIYGTSAGEINLTNSNITKSFRVNSTYSCTVKGFETWRFLGGT